MRVKIKLKKFLNLIRKILNSKNLKIVFLEKNIIKNVIIFLRSINHEMYLQEIKKSTLSYFDDKRCYENNIRVCHGSKIPSVRKYEQPHLHFLFIVLTLIFVILSFLTQSRLSISQIVSFDLTISF